MSQDPSSKGFMIGYQIGSNMSHTELAQVMRQIPGTYRKLAEYKRRMSAMLAKHAEIMDRVADMFEVSKDHYLAGTAPPVEHREKYAALTREMFDIASEIHALEAAVRRAEDNEFRALGLNPEAIRSAAHDTIPCAPAVSNGKRGEA